MRQSRIRGLAPRHAGVHHSGALLHTLAALTALSLGLASCGSSSSGSAPMDLIEVSNGFGRLLPHEVILLDDKGEPGNERVAIRSLEDLVSNVTLANPVLPVTHWPEQAILPSGRPGNHYLYVEFSEPLDVASVLSSKPWSGAAARLTDAVEVLAVNPQDGSATPLPGRVFVDGQTFAGMPEGEPLALPLQRWVHADSDTGKPVALDVGGALPGLGFPGTQDDFFQGGTNLISERTLVFVLDSDGDLTTHETFPQDRQIVLRANAKVRSQAGKPLIQGVLGSSTVGPDAIPPEVLLLPPPEGVPVISPAFAAIDVDPTAPITMHFTEPVQPLSVGSLPSGMPPGLSSAIRVHFGPTILETDVPFTATPASVYDLSTWVLTPAFSFPGSGPEFATCGTFATVSIDVAPQQLIDLAPGQTPAGGGNRNTLPAASYFTTGEGPGLVNAPVTPDVIYAGRSGGTPSVSVIDLNGFGQSTGDPSFDFTYSSFPAGHSNFPNNPNLKLQGALISPQLRPGTCTVDGGSSGVFSLTRDTSLDSRLIRNPLIQSVEDIMIGQALDLVFHNGKDTAGCLSGGGNICSINGLKVNDGGNPVQFAPHPNPPPLSFPPLCVQPYIGGAEPTSIASAGVNLLFPGDALGKPDQGIPPSGLLSSGSNTGFGGPGIPGTPLAACPKYAMRQQVGHFLYVIDRVRRELVVLNSNRFTVLDRISLPDPTDLAMGPNLDFMAVSSQKANSVAFIDIDPASSSFHQVVKTVQVDAGPRGIAWDPGNESLIVCCEKQGTAMVISAFDFSVSKTLTNSLTQPFDVAITQRQTGFGTSRNTWFGWILNRNGELAIYESGPDGPNGWGFNDVIGVSESNFDLPQRIVVDVRELRGSVWIAHQNPLAPDGTPSGKTGGAVSNVTIDASAFGQLTLGNLAGNPGFRQMSLKLQGSFGSEVLTGVPSDIAMDDILNVSLLVNLQSPQGAGLPKATNGKAAVRGEVMNNFSTGLVIRAKSPEFLFVSVPNSTEGPGVVDVIRLGSALTRFDTNPHLPGVQSIPVPDVRLLADYWRQ